MIQIHYTTTAAATAAPATTAAATTTHAATTTAPPYCSTHTTACLNGGTCINGATVTAYTCSCASGFIGPECQFQLGSLSKRNGRGAASGVPRGKSITRPSSQNKQKTH